MSRDYATGRVSTSEWDVYAEHMPDNVEGKARELANVTRACFTSPAGRKMLDRMIATYLLQKPFQAPENGTDAAYRDGQASVVKQILMDMKVGAKHGN